MGEFSYVLFLNFTLTQTLYTLYLLFTNPICVLKTDLLKGLFQNIRKKLDKRIVQEKRERMLKNPKLPQNLKLWFYISIKNYKELSRKKN